MAQFRFTMTPEDKPVRKKHPPKLKVNYTLDIPGIGQVNTKKYDGVSKIKYVDTLSKLLSCKNKTGGGLRGVAKDHQYWHPDGLGKCIHDKCVFITESGDYIIKLREA